jgi:hypothetical protein
MPAPSANGKADGKVWEVHPAVEGAGSVSLQRCGWYTIEYVAECHDGVRPAVSPMLFRDRDTALASARALLSAGFLVSRVVGPDFQIGGTALVPVSRVPSSI